MSSKIQEIHAVELFAGAGGLALGLERVGFHLDALVECNKDAAQTLRANRPEWNVIEEDICKVAKQGIRPLLKDKTQTIDLVSGGYPCQSFSYAGRRLGLDDVRGTMFYYFASILKELAPKVFLAENVRGLLSHDGGKTLRTMLDVYEGLGYRTEVHLVNALDYDVPQKRQRLILVGMKKTLHLSYRLPQEHKEKRTLRDALKNVPASDGATYPKSKADVLALVPPGGCWRDLPENIAKAYMGKSYTSGGGRTGMARRLSWDEPSLTLTCSPSQKQTERCHPDETRPLTIREYARIQTFPDDWTFCGSKNAQYRQIGNAVPVKLAEAIGMSIMDIFRNRQQTDALHEK